MCELYERTSGTSGENENPWFGKAGDESSWRKKNFPLGFRGEKWGEGATKYINAPQSIFKQQREPFISL